MTGKEEENSRKGILYVKLADNDTVMNLVMPISDNMFFHKFKIIDHPDKSHVITHYSKSYNSPNIDSYSIYYYDGEKGQKLFQFLKDLENSPLHLRTILSRLEMEYDFVEAKKPGFFNRMTSRLNSFLFPDPFSNGENEEAEGTFSPNPSSLDPERLD